MQARRGYRIGANPTTQGVGERDDGPHSNKPTRRNACETVQYLLAIELSTMSWLSHSIHHYPRRSAATP